MNQLDKQLQGYTQGYVMAYNKNGHSVGKPPTTSQVYKQGYYMGVQKYNLDKYGKLNPYIASFARYDKVLSAILWRKVCTRINDTLGAI